MKTPIIVLAVIVEPHTDDAQYEFQVLIVTTIDQNSMRKLFETKPVLFDASLTCSISIFLFR